MAPRRRSRTRTNAAPVPAAPWFRPWLAVAIVVAISTAAWFGAGTLARRAQARRIPVVPDLSALSPAGQAQVMAQVVAVRGNPTSANAVGELGRAYQANLLIAPAIETYALAAQMAPGDWRWTYHRALLLEERGEQTAAAELLSRVTSAEPRHGLAWFRLAEAAFKEGRLADAERAYTRAREVGALPATAPVAVGAPARQTPPLAAYADFGLARVTLERGDGAAGRAALEALITAHPQFGSARALLDQVREPASTGGEEPSVGTRPPDAVRAYVPPADVLLDTVVARSYNSDLLLKHAAMAARGGDFAWREYLVRRALAANPQALDVLLEMASLLQASGKATEALTFLTQAERLAPGDHHLLVEQGRSLADVGRLDEAEAVLRRAVRVRDAAAEYNLGTVLDRQGRWDEARERYERALAIDPFHARALNNLGVGLDRRGHSREALALLTRSLQAGPSNAETYSNFGSALVGAGRLADAISALETSLALDPTAPDTHNNLGIALAQSGRPTEARAQFAEALRRDPRHVNARRNLEQLIKRGR